MKIKMYNFWQKVILTCMWLPANYYVLKETWDKPIWLLPIIMFIACCGFMMLIHILDQGAYKEEQSNGRDTK